jgi:hypothetical protein
MPTKEQLQQRVRELEEENDELQDQLDRIFNIVAPPEEHREDEKDGMTARAKADPASVRRDLAQVGLEAHRPAGKPAT